jgi:hypothetical protein
MTDIPNVELPQFATLRARLAANIEFARECVSYRLGYEVEMAGLEPVEREGQSHMRVFWRRKEGAPATDHSQEWHVGNS